MSPKVSMHIAISRVLLNMSASAPNTGCINAYGKVKAVDSNAAVAGSTFNPPAICGMTGSTERMNSDVAKITNAKRLMTLPHAS